MLNPTFIETGKLVLERDRDGYVHCKRVPYLIVAEAYEGYYEISVDGAPEVVLQEGECFVTPPDQALRITHRVNPESGRMRARWMHFIMRKEGGFSAVEDVLLPQKLSGTASRRASCLIREASNAVKDTWKLYAQTRMERTAFQMFELLLSCSSPLPETRHPYRDALGATLEYIEKHWNTEINMDCLIRECSMSRAAFYRCFRDEFHCSPAAFILRKRISIASALFDSGRVETVKEAAEQCGFKNEFHFSRCFKRCTGKSPRDFLKTVRFF